MTLGGREWWRGQCSGEGSRPGPGSEVPALWATRNRRPGQGGLRSAGLSAVGPPARAGCGAPSQRMRSTPAPDGARIPQPGRRAVLHPPTPVWSTQNASHSRTLSLPPARPARDPRGHHRAGARGEEPQPHLALPSAATGLPGQGSRVRGAGSREEGEGRGKVGRGAGEK